MWLARLSTLLAALWAGAVLTLALLTAPTLFAQLERGTAGQVAGALFRLEAHLGLGIAMLLFMVERHLARQAALREGGNGISVEALLVLGALFCTVLGYFALQPLMVQARAGQGIWSFGALHGASSALFALKGLLLLALTWRGMGTRPSLAAAPRV